MIPCDTLFSPWEFFVWGGLGMGCLQASWFRWHKKCALSLTGHICYDCHFSRWIEIFFHKEQVSYVTGFHPILKEFFFAAFWTSKSILLWGVQAFAVAIQGFWEQSVFLFSEKLLIVITVFLWGPIINLESNVWNWQGKGILNFTLHSFARGKARVSYGRIKLKFVEIKKRHEFTFKGNPWQHMNKFVCHLEVWLEISAEPT